MDGKAHTAKYLLRTKALRLSSKFVRATKPNQLDWLLHEIERIGSPDDLDLTVPSWRTSQVIVEQFVIAGPESVTVPPLTHQVAELNSEQYSWPQLCVRTLHSVVLDADSGLVFARERVLRQSGGGTRSARDAAFISGAYLRYSRSEQVEMDTPIAPLDDTSHYYHFLVETLPRVLNVLAVEPATVFVTTQEPNTVATEILKLLKVTVKVLPRGALIKCAKLVLADQPVKFWSRPHDLATLRQAFESALKNDGTLINNSVYISRSRSARAPMGEEELERAMREHGIHVAHLESLSFTSQVELLSSAKIIIGAHGAGLANMIFQPTGARVIEISSGDRFESCYRRMCAALGMDYTYVPIPGSENAPFGELSSHSISEVVSEL